MFCPFWNTEIHSLNIFFSLQCTYCRCYINSERLKGLIDLTLVFSEILVIGYTSLCRHLSKVLIVLYEVSKEL